SRTGRAGRSARDRRRREADGLLEVAAPAHGRHVARLQEVAQRQGDVVQEPADPRHETGQEVKRTVALEPGFFLRISPRTGTVLPTIWFHYTDATGRVRQQSAHTTSIRAARTRRAEREAERARAG